MDSYFDFESYADDVQQSDRVPYCQIITPREKKAQFGFFIPEAQAKLANFQADSDWNFVDEYFTNAGKETLTRGWMPEAVPIEGTRNFVSRHVRMAIIKTTKLYAYIPNNFGKSQPVDLYFAPGAGGELTGAGRRVKENGSDARYFRANKHLFYFLGTKNEKLHDRPFQLKGKGGFGGSFGSELKLFYDEMNQAFFDAARAQGIALKGQMLDIKLRSLNVFTIALSMKDNTLATGAQGALSTYIYSRAIPSIDASIINTTQMIDRDTGNGRIVKMEAVNVDWRSVIIGKNTPTGQELLDEHDFYKEWGELHLSSADNGGDNGTRNSLMAGIDSLIGKLGWGVEEARALLMEHFVGKRSRTQLSTDELAHYLDLLDQTYAIRSQQMAAQASLSEGYEEPYDGQSFPAGYSANSEVSSNNSWDAYPMNEEEYLVPDDIPY